MNDVLVVAGDTLFANDFQLSTFLETRETDGDNVVYYELVDPEEVSKRGIIEIDTHGIVKNFIEKPNPAATASRLVSQKKNPRSQGSFEFFFVL